MPPSSICSRWAKRTNSSVVLWALSCRLVMAHEMDRDNFFFMTRKLSSSKHESWTIYSHEAASFYPGYAAAAAAAAAAESVHGEIPATTSHPEDSYGAGKFASGVALIAGFSKTNIWQARWVKNHCFNSWDTLFAFVSPSNLPHAFLPELQRIKDIVVCGSLAAEVAGRCHK